MSSSTRRDPGVARPADRYIVTTRRERRVAQQEFDAIVIALPYNQLRDIEWAGERLRRAMATHVAHYDRPGHYLRISILFDRPFWRHLMTGSWTMLDAFGGCCVYDETPGAGARGTACWAGCSRAPMRCHRAMPATMC